MDSIKNLDKISFLALKEGNDLALNYFYKKYNRKVYSVAFYILKDRFLAEDTLQEVFVHFWKNREFLNDEKDLWIVLYVMTKQKSLNLLRSRMRYEFHKLKHHDTHHHVYCDEQIGVKEIKNLVKIALQNMTPAQQRVFQLSREEGMTHFEIANLLSVSTNTVKNHMVAALTIIRRYFKGYEFLILFFYFFLVL